MLSADHCTLIKQSLLGELFDGFGYPCNVLSSAYRIVYVNRAFCRFYGYKLEQVIGLSPKVLLPRNFQSKKITDIQKHIIVKKKPHVGEIGNVTAKGSEIKVFIVIIPIVPIKSNNPVAHLSVCCIPEKKEAMLLSLLEHVSNFTYLYNKQVKREEIKIKSYQRGDRQAEIMKLTHLGYSTKEIAGIMGISISTVGFVKWKMSDKVGLSNK
jgi:PAS domain S-box-containing protein